MLVSVNDLCNYMGGLKPRPGMRKVMAEVIAGTQEALENYLNRPVEPVQIREYVVSNSKGFVHLSVYPVHRVLRYGVNVVPGYDELPVNIPPVMTRDPIHDVDDRVLDRAYPQPQSGFSIGPGGLYTYAPNTPVMVEYIGGLNGYTINAIKQAIKRVAAREWAENNVDTVGSRQGVVGETEVGDQRSIGWANDELRALQRHRRRVVRRA